MPAFLWENSAVAVAVQRVMECAQREEFTGDWDEASTSLEETMDALASTLRRIAMKNTFDLNNHWAGRSAGRASQSEQNKLSESDERKSGADHPRPKTLRQDVGSQVVAEYFTWVLQGDDVAVNLRKEVCGDEVLTRAEAWDFLTSPLPKVLRFKDYERLGLCPVKASGKVLSIKDQNDKSVFLDHDVSPLHLREESIHRFQVQIFDPTSKTKNGSKAHFSVEWDKRELVSLFSQDTTQRAYISHYEISDGMPDPTPFFSESRRYVEGYFDSVIGHLLDFANCMCQFYRVTLWDMLEALVTGRFPAQPTIIATAYEVQTFGVDLIYPGGYFKAQGPVNLTVQPWVTPEVLADAWREHRKNHASYSPSEKQADALRFVLSHTTPGEEFAWEEMARQWQAERGERVTRGQLYKQFQRAQAAILPGYCEVQEK